MSFLRVSIVYCMQKMMGWSVFGIQPSARMVQRWGVGIINMSFWKSIGLFMVMRVVDIWPIVVCTKHSQIRLVCTLLYPWLLCQFVGSGLLICLLAEGYFIVRYIFGWYDLLLGLARALLLVNRKIVQLFCWGLASGVLVKCLICRLVFLTSCAIFMVSSTSFFS